MATPFDNLLPAVPPAQDLHGFLWARIALLFLGLSGVILSFMCVGIPLVYAVVLAWRAVDRAEAYAMSGIAEDAVESTRGFLGAVKWGLLGYLLMGVGYAVLMTGLTLLGIALDSAGFD